MKIREILCKCSRINRRNGRDLKNPVTNCREDISGEYLSIIVAEPKIDWREWISEPVFPCEVDSNQVVGTERCCLVYDSKRLAEMNKLNDVSLNTFSDPRLKRIDS